MADRAAGAGDAAWEPGHGGRRLRHLASALSHIERALPLGVTRRLMVSRRMVQFAQARPRPRDATAASLRRGRRLLGRLFALLRLRRIADDIEIMADVDGGQATQDAARNGGLGGLGGDRVRHDGGISFC